MRRFGWFLTLLLLPVLALAQVSTFPRYRIAGGASGALLEVTAEGELMMTAQGTASPASPQSGVSTFPRVRIAGGTSGNLAEVDSAGRLLVTGAGSEPGGSTTELQFNNAGTLGGASLLTYDSANGRLGINDPTPEVMMDVKAGPGITGPIRSIYSQAYDYAGGSGAGINLNLQSYYTSINPGSPFNSSHNVLFGKLYYGLQDDRATLVAAEGTTSTVGISHDIYSQADQESEYTVLYGGVRFNIGTGYSPSGTFAGNDLGQTAGPAGSLFGILDLNVMGPIAVQPGLLNVQMNYINNYYNGQPSRGSNESGGIWVVTGFGKGGQRDALHQAATTYPVAVGVGCAGTSGSALPGATAGFTTCFRAGGAGGPWGAAGNVDSSIIGTGFRSRDYNLYGLHISNAISPGIAIRVDSTAGISSFGTNVAIGGTTATKDLSFEGNAQRTIWMERNSTANTAGATFFVQSGGATSGATDKISGNLRLQAGIHTGNAIPGLVQLESGGLSATSGTTDGTIIPRYVANGHKVLTDNSAINIAQFTCSSGFGFGAVVHYLIEVIDGTDRQVETGAVYLSAVNKGGAVTVTINEVNSQQAVSAGTLATTWALSAANPAVLSINANSDLTPSTGYPRITYSVMNFGQQGMNVL